MVVEGRINADFFDRQIAPARAELAACEVSLDAMPATNGVTLHPGTLAAMAEVLAIVAAELPNADPEKDRDAIEAIRSLIRHVTVIERDDGGVDCEITGTIALSCRVARGGGKW